jgi:ABC-type transporter Mla subunit MlaD
MQDSLSLDNMLKSELANNLYETLLPFFNDSNTALLASIFIGIIIFLFGIALFLFYKKSAEIQKGLSEVKSIIGRVNKENLEEHYENLSSKLKKNKKIGHLWQEFSETVVKTKGDEDNFKIYNTVDANRLFNFDTLVKTNLNIRFYNALPGILTGLGLLGTFIGITVGLSGMPGAEATSSELKDGITKLLSGARLAFSTSVWGIILSLAFNAIEKYYVKSIGDKVRSLQSEIDSLFTKAVTEDILLKSFQQNKRQTEELRKFNNDLVFRIGDALDEAVAKNFTPVFEELLGAVEELREVKQESATEAISELAEEFKTAMTAGANQQIDQMSSTLQETAELLNDANQKTARDQEMMKQMLDDHLSSFKENIDSIMNDLAQQQQTNNQELQESMESVLEKIDYGMQRTDKHFENLMDETQQSVNENLNGVRELFEQLSSDFSEKIESLTARYDKERDSLERILDKVDDQIQSFSQSVESMDGVSIKIKEIVPRIERTSNSLAKSVSNFSESQEDMLGTLVEIQEKYQGINAENEEMLKQMRNALEETKNHWSAYENRFENLREDLNGVFGELQEGLSEYQSQTRSGLTQNLQEFDDIMGNAIRSLSGGVDEIKELLEEIEMRSNGAN